MPDRFSNWMIFCYTCAHRDEINSNNKTISDKRGVGGAELFSIQKLCL